MFVIEILIFAATNQMIVHTWALTTVLLRISSQSTQTISALPIMVLF